MYELDSRNERLAIAKKKLSGVVNGLALLGICFLVETMAMMKNDIQYRGCKLQMFTSCISVISS